MRVATEQRAWAKQSASSFALMALSENGCSSALMLSLCLASQPLPSDGSSAGQTTMLKRFSGIQGRYKSTQRAFTRKFEWLHKVMVLAKCILQRQCLLKCQVLCCFTSNLGSVSGHLRRTQSPGPLLLLQQL